MSDSSRPHELQPARPPCPSPIPEAHSDSCPSSQWCHPSHLILCRPLFLLPPILPSISLFQWVNSLHEVAKVLEFQLQHRSLQRNPRTDLLQNGLVGSLISLYCRFHSLLTYPNIFLTAPVFVSDAQPHPTDIYLFSASHGAREAGETEPAWRQDCVICCVGPRYFCHCVKNAP